MLTKIPDSILFAILDTLMQQGIFSVTFSYSEIGDVRFNLPCDDADYITFHREYTPVICDKLRVHDYQTTKEPVHSDWYMTINYHC